MVDVLRRKKNRKMGQVESLDQGSGGKCLYFLRYPNSLKAHVAQPRVASVSKASSIHFDRTPTCDSCADGHRAIPRYAHALCMRRAVKKESRYYDSLCYLLLGSGYIEMLNLLFILS